MGKWNKIKDMVRKDINDCLSQAQTTNSMYAYGNVLGMTAVAMLCDILTVEESRALLTTCKAAREEVAKKVQELNKQSNTNGGIATCRSDQMMSDLLQIAYSGRLNTWLDEFGPFLNGTLPLSSIDPENAERVIFLAKFGLLVASQRITEDVTVRREMLL